MRLPLSDSTEPEDSEGDEEEEQQQQQDEEDCEEEDAESGSSGATTVAPADDDTTLSPEEVAEINKPAITDEQIAKIRGGDFTAGKPHKPHNRIYNGYNAESGQWPSYVRVRVIGKNPNEEYVCGSVLLDPTHVLTAAHCLEHSDRQYVYPGMVEAKDMRSVQNYTVVQTCKSKKFQMDKDREPMAEYDVAILKLDNAVEFTKSVQPACLPTRELTENEIVHSVGFGAAAEKDGKTLFPRELQVISMKRVEPCYDDIAPSVMCLHWADPNHKGTTCGGDSGGPTLSTSDGSCQTVWGLTSFGDSNCNLGKESGHVDVFNLLDEIALLRKECE